MCRSWQAANAACGPASTCCLMCLTKAPVVSGSMLSSTYMPLMTCWRIYDQLELMMVVSCRLVYILEYRAQWQGKPLIWRNLPCWPYDTCLMYACPVICFLDGGAARQRITVRELLLALPTRSEAASSVLLLYLLYNCNTGRKSAAADKGVSSGVPSKI